MATALTKFALMVGMVALTCDSRGQPTNTTAPSRAPGVRRVGPVHPGFNSTLPTVWLIGDSTVKNSWDAGDGGLWGWGNPIAAWFDWTKINVENQALGGTSSRSFITSKLWDEVLPQIKPGDFVIMQFGHNDGGAVTNVPGRASMPGNGEETKEITRADGTTEAVHTYGWYIRKYVQDTKSKGATAIVCSLIPRNTWTDGKVRRANTGYGKWAKEAADESGAFFVDLNEIIADRYDKLGQEAVKPFFPKDRDPHTGWDGAVLNAECVIEGIKGLKDCPLNACLLANPERPKQPAAPAKAGGANP